MTDWIPAITICAVGIWLNLCIWATNQKSPPAFFRGLFTVWDHLKSALGVYRLNQWLSDRARPS